MLSVYFLLLMVHDSTQYTYFSVTGIFSVTDTPWSQAARIREVLLYSSTVVKVVGSNAVPVLATLFLLSYMKLQHTIISAFSFTFIQHEDGTVTPVWLYDGNIPFLKGIAKWSFI